MITSLEKTKLSKILRNNYSYKVIDILNKKGLTNKFGKPYSPSSIRMVFNGHNENLDIELAIYELRDDILAKEQKLQTIRNQSNEKASHTNNR